MTATATQPTTFTELLAPTKTCPKGMAYDWTRKEGAGFEGAGLLTIKNRRIYTSYTVTEFAVDWDGRGFTLTKQTEGSDPTEEAYSCFVAKSGPHAHCSCRGFTYTSGCKHVAAIKSLIESKQL